VAGYTPGRVENDYSPSTFTKEQARFLDRCLRGAEATPVSAKAALIKLLAIRVALMAHPMSQVRAGTIHRLETGEYESITESCLSGYVNGLRLTRPSKLWELAQQSNAGVFLGQGEVIQRSVLEVLPEIQADVAYFDPPYPGVMSYEKEYKVIDQILEGSSRPTSPFTPATPHLMALEAEPQTAPPARDPGLNDQGPEIVPSAHDHGRVGGEVQSKYTVDWLSWVAGLGSNLSCRPYASVAGWGACRFSGHAD